MRKRKGFTLAELLIVTAIIAVLVAISIPIFSSQLEKSRLAVDMANVRSAKAAAAAAYMSDGESGSVSYLYAGGTAIRVDGDHVETIASLTRENGYGKSHGNDADGSKTGASGTPENAFVEVTVNNGTVSAIWTGGSIIYDKAKGTLTLTGKTINNKNLLDEVRALGMDPASVKEIVAADGAVIENDTESVFKGFDNLTRIDLSKAVLKHSSQNMLANLSNTVQEIVLPQCSSKYSIAGVWYDASGNHNVPPKWAWQGSDPSQGTRITENMSGKTIYRHATK